MLLPPSRINEAPQFKRGLKTASLHNAGSHFLAKLTSRLDRRGALQFSFGKLSGRRDIGPRTPTPGPILLRLRLD
jgi:hypothetical protein